MKDISIYFQPVDIALDYTDEEAIGKNLCSFTKDNFPEIEKSGIAIIEVSEYRNRTNTSKQLFKNKFREAFYQLYPGTNWSHTIYDLGNILPGASTKDTFYALQVVCEELIKSNITPIIIGGTQDLTLAMSKAYENLEQLINITTIDKQIDIGNPNKTINPEGWIGHLLATKNCNLFNFSAIATQQHFISNSTLKLFEELYFDSCRLGDLNANITIAEPVMRNTDLLSVDLNSLRASELQNEHYTSPNGLFAQELCKLMHYAGISDKLTSVGIFNYFSEQHKTSDNIIAQLIWYFNEGYANRKGDFPVSSKKDYTKFRVFLEEIKEEIIFYKSDKSSRWWIEVPFPGSESSKYLRHQMVPCSYETYKETMQGEVPNLWWKTYQKLV